MTEALLNKDLRHSDIFSDPLLRLLTPDETYKLVERDLTENYYLHLIFNLIDFLFPGASDFQVHGIKRFLLFEFFIAAELDNLIDERTPRQTGARLRRLMAFLNASRSSLSSISNLEQPFWEEFQGLYQRFFSVVQRESELSLSGGSMSEDAYVALAREKSVLCLVIPLIYRFVTPDAVKTAELESVVSDLHVSMQIVDDVDDLMDDIQGLRWNYFVTQTTAWISKTGIRCTAESDPAKFKKLFYLSGLAEQGYELARRYAEGSCDCIAESYPEMTRVLRTHESAIRRRRDLIRERTASSMGGKAALPA